MNTSTVDEVIQALQELKEKGDIQGDTQAYICCYETLSFKGIFDVFLDLNDPDPLIQRSKKV
jgi:hypothetical protein